MPPNSSDGTMSATNVGGPIVRDTVQHGIKGAFYGGDWVDIEDCVGTYMPSEDKCKSCPHNTPCPRSKSRNDASKKTLSITNENGTSSLSRLYDVCIIGAGCVGSSIARELSKYNLSVLLLEAADDVSQGATKGNSGIVHAGYDDKPNTNRAKFCWKGNQMFRQLDKELRFGYQVNGSLVLAFMQSDIGVLEDLLKRGKTNGVERLRIIGKEELFEMEPNVNPKAIGALYSPDAGNVIPYEFAIAMAENAVENGVELRIRREVTAIEKKTEGKDGDLFQISVRHWEPQLYAELSYKSTVKQKAFALIALCTMCAILLCIFVATALDMDRETRERAKMAAAVLSLVSSSFFYLASNKPSMTPAQKSIAELTKQASPPVGSGENSKVNVEEMLKGGSGSCSVVKGVPVKAETVHARYVVNCAGGGSDKISKMIGDNSFTIKPRLGDYILLNRNQGHLTRRTLFPCPDPVLGKGVLVQTTLWGNLILGPTARDTYKTDAMSMSPSDIQEYILSKCKQLVPYFDPKESFHGFCGARAKNSTGDWIIQPSDVEKDFIHVAGIDSPGLAGSPAIAVEVVDLLQNAGLSFQEDPNFNPNRAPIVTPKNGMRGLKMGPVGKNDSVKGDLNTEEKIMASNVICKCEKVTELEVVRAMRRSLPIDSTQAIRKRTRAGMGHCQGDPENYNCECRVKAIIARENKTSIDEVGGRPWPATTTLPKRWLDDKDKLELEKRMMAK